MKKTFDKKHALKLINQYADSYKRLEEENKSLLKEITDLKSNLTVNKDIIDSLMKNNSLDAKVKGFLVKSKEEIDMLNLRNEQLTKENSNLRIKSLKYETTINDALNFHREAKDSLANRVFILENSIKKKDSMINWLNKKIKALRESDFQYEYSNELHEIYICDPNESLNSLYGDLLLYKQAFENSLVKIKESKIEITRLQKRVDFYAKNSGCNNKEKEKDTKTTIDELNTILLRCQKKTWETEEWFAILSFLNITKEDIDTHTQNHKFVAKIMEAIELLNKVIIQRNHQLDQMSKDYDKQRDSNTAVNNENLGLMKSIFAMKNQIEAMRNKGGEYNGNNGNGNSSNSNANNNNEQYINTNISMVNNISLDDANVNVNKKDLNYTIGFNIKDSFLQNFMCNQSMMTYENNNSNSFNKSNSSIGGKVNLTQVTENSFDIIESSDFIASIQKKQLKRIKPSSEATNTSFGNDSSVVSGGNSVINKVNSINNNNNTPVIVASNKGIGKDNKKDKAKGIF